MKKKILSLILAMCLLIPCAFMFSACEEESFEYRIQLNLPTNIQVEYSQSLFAGDISPNLFKYARVDNEEYAYISGTSPQDFFKITNSIDSTFTCFYFSDQWMNSNGNNGDSSQADSQRIADSTQYFTDGFSDINADEKGTSYTQGENENVTIENSGTFECLTYSYEYANGNISLKEKYWYHATSKVLLKKTTVYTNSANQSPDADENICIKVTKYKTENLNMTTILSDYGLTKPTVSY